MTDQVVAAPPPVTGAEYLRDVAERAVVTFVVAVLSLLSAELLTDLDVDTGKKLATAGLVALASFVKTLAFPKAGFGLGPWADVASRAAFSFVQAGAAVIVAGPYLNWFTASAWEAVYVAGAAAAISVLKGSLALRMRKPTVTPASLAPEPA